MTASSPAATTGDGSSRLAPAKVNLCLHVRPPDATGYHPIQSLVAFADIGDRLSLRAGPGLVISGPFAAGLGAGSDNLVIRAVRCFEAATFIQVNHGFHLDKQLPLASGIGGGSADAGAALRLLRAAYAPDLSDRELEAMATTLGADGPMCLWCRPVLAEGRGEKLTPLGLPPVPAVMINPGAACATGDVYRGFDAAEPPPVADVALAFTAGMSLDALLDALDGTRNDLQPPAIVLCPVIADILAGLDAQPETRLARMSGSGATCFALCRTDADAVALGRRMQGLWPAAWVRACRLG